MSKAPCPSPGHLGGSVPWMSPTRSGICAWEAFEELVEAGKTGQHFLGLARLLDQKKKAKALRLGVKLVGIGEASSQSCNPLSSWSNVAGKASALLNGAPVESRLRVCAEASSCKATQVLSCLLAGRTFGRCRKADQERMLKPSAFGLRLRKLAGKEKLWVAELTQHASSWFRGPRTVMQHASKTPRHSAV